MPGAEKIFTATSASAGPSSRPSADPQNAAAQKPTSGALSYSQFAITSPSPDQTFFGDELIGVHLALDPSLKADQAITWHLNGKQLDDQGPTTTQFALPHLDRGTYVIAATITDQKTGESMSTDSVNFFVRQPSELAPQHQKP